MMIDNLKISVEPIIKELYYEFYYLEFVKENND